jgi:hypothetical protein
MADIRQGGGTPLGTGAHFPVQRGAAVLQPQGYADMPAVIALAVKKINRQFFLQIGGKYGDADLKTVGKTVYQLFDLSGKKYVQGVHGHSLYHSYY